MRARRCKLTISLGATITEKRKQKGLTQAQLAGLLGIGQVSLSQMENGLIAPKVARLQDIADALSCTVADLFRPAHLNASQKAAIIADMVQALPERFQDMLFSMIESAASSLKDGGEKNT